MREVSFQLICWRSGLHINAENERFTAVALRCRQNLKFDNSAFSFSFCQNKSTKHIQIRAARALYVQPTRSVLRVRGDN